MPICTTCGAFHSVAGDCPKLRKANAPTSIDHLFKPPTDVNPDQEQQPLRKRQLNKATGREDNFIETYYAESKRVAQMGRDEVENTRARFEIEVEGDRVPNPITSFREAGLSHDIVHHIERLGFREPTPIQMQSLPCLLSGRDVVGMAETGSGKTLCYILPMLMFLRRKPPTGPGEGPLVIILAPTRELVEQIYSETIKLMPQVAMSIKATSSTPVPTFAPSFSAPAPIPVYAPTPIPSPSPSTSVSDFARKIQLQKQQLQVKQQQALQQQQFQQMQQSHMLELQQIQHQQAYELSQFTPEQALAQVAQLHNTQMLQIASQHQAQLSQLSAEHAQQQQLLLAEHTQQHLAQQQKQQQKQEQADYTLYSQAAANGQYDYTNYNYETAAAYYTQHGAEAQEYSYPTYTAPEPVPANTPPATPRKVLGVCGGVPIQIQITPLQMGVDILVSTPGRLIDLISKGVCKLDRVSYMVFDEADRMLALEMEVQLRHIVTQASICVRQSVLFSATFPPAVERLVRSAVSDPIYVRVGAGNTAAEAITQNVIFMHSGEKRAKLLEVLRETSKPPVLIFANSHHTVDYLVKVLREEQFHVAGLHSDKSQPFRFRAMKAFKDGALDILVATDVASRGIDVSDVTHVILYDLPDNIEDYIHRIGRTGRAGKNGMASAFLTLDCKIADELRRLLKQSKQVIPQELQQNSRQFGGEIVRGELRDYAVKKRLL